MGQSRSVYRKIGEGNWRLYSIRSDGQDEGWKSLVPSNHAFLGDITLDEQSAERPAASAPETAKPPPSFDPTT
jgi:hypothetical protein